MAKKEMPKDYNLLKTIQSEKYYKSNTGRRDNKVRDILEKKEHMVSPNKLVLGELYLFDYFRPKTKEDLEYYDARPCSIVFGLTHTQEGEPRVLCFNIHYYPPRIRFRVMDKIMTIYKQFYEDHWDSAKLLSGGVTSIDYSTLLNQLQRAKLDFGVRMYIPELIGKCWYVSPENWSKAVFTEGRFHKRTRDAILKYWKEKK